MYQYKTANCLPISLGEVWQFFSSTKILSLRKTPVINYPMLSSLVYGIYEEVIVDYKAIPLVDSALSWETKIYKIERGKYFTDGQLKRPYKVWKHTHTFTESIGSVPVNDVVKYQLPFSFIIKTEHPLYIKNKIENSLSFRKNTRTKMFIRK